MTFQRHLRNISISILVLLLGACSGQHGNAGRDADRAHDGPDNSCGNEACTGHVSDGATHDAAGDGAAARVDGSSADAGPPEPDQGTPITGTEYFISPTGSDKNSGTSKTKPFETFAHAIVKLEAGDALTLLDGTYTSANAGMLYVACSRSNVSKGSAGKPVTLRAEHERKTWIKGDGRVTPVRVYDCAYWDLTGLRASSAARDGGADGVIEIKRSHHIRLRRILAHTSNRYNNNAVIELSRTHHSLVEESEVYDFHRHGVSVYQSDAVVIRRVYANGRGAKDVAGGWSSHGCCTKGGDEAFSFYYTSNSILENSISVDSEHLSRISGYDTVLGNPAGRTTRRWETSPITI